MWWTVSEQSVLARRASRSRTARRSGPRARSNGRSRLRRREPLRLGAARARPGSGREVDQRQDPTWPAGRDHLHRPAVDRAEGGAQHLVPAHHLASAAARRRRRAALRRSAAPAGCCRPGSRLELVEEPEPLLGEGERDRVEAGRPARDAAAGGAAARSFSSRLRTCSKRAPTARREPGEAILGRGGSARQLISPDCSDAWGRVARAPPFP